jgi:hypothetical protein
MYQQTHAQGDEMIILKLENISCLGDNQLELLSCSGQK